MEERKRDQGALGRQEQPPVLALPPEEDLESPSSTRLEALAPSVTRDKTSLNIRKFMVHVLLKPGLENFEHYFTSM